jgi:hypothetical protein
VAQRRYILKQSFCGLFLTKEDVKARYSLARRERDRERERELRKEGRVVPSRVKLRKGPINVTELQWAKPTIPLRLKTVVCSARLEPIFSPLT